MNIIEKSSAPYKSCKGKKLKSQKINMLQYKILLAELENLGVISITFDENLPYVKRIKILKDIIKKVR